MIDWHIEVGFRTDRAFSEETPFDLLEALTDHSAAISVARTFDGGDVGLHVNAENLEAATTQGIEAVRRELARLGFQTELISLEAVTEEKFYEELASPPSLEVVGYAEIAKMAGVSRQRARQFAGLEGFPKPVLVTGRGPLMIRFEVAKWLSEREARLGRREKVG